MSKKSEIIYRIIYSLCFFLLCIINWGSVTLDGRVQFVLTNVTGLALAVIILSGYRVKDFMKPIYAIWTGIIALFIPIVVIMGIRYYPYKGQWISGVINTCVYGYILIAVLRKNLVEKKYSRVNWPLLFGWVCMMILMVLSRDDSNWPLWFGGMFGSLYLTDFDDKKRRLLLESLVSGIIAGFFVIQGAALLFRPFDEARYYGLFLNPNMDALMYVMSYAAFLCAWFLLKKRNSNIVFRIVLVLFSGSLWGFVFLTGCRTAFLSMSAITIVFMLCLVWREKRKIREAIKVFATILLVAILSTPIVFLAVRYVPAIHLHPVFFANEYHNWGKVHSGDPRNSDKYTTFESVLTYNLGNRMNELLGIDSTDILNILVPTIKVYAAEETEQYLIEPDGNLSGLNIRYQIYKWYFKNLNVFGHTKNENQIPAIGNDYIATHAHNWWLQLTFNFGIPVGILLIAVVLIYFKSFYDLMQRNEDERACIMGCFIIAFLTFGTFEVDYSLGQLSFTLFFFFFAEALSKPIKKVS